MTRPSVLVLHDRPDELRPLLSTRLSDLDLTFASAPDAVLPALERARPEVVFSIKHSGFPGAAHRPAIDFPTVRWVQIGGSGYEHFAPWDARRVTVTNCHGVLARVLAETVLAAVLTLNRGLLAHRDRQRARVWSPTRFRPLAGQTLLIVGVGAIGGELATLARALGLHVVGIRRGAVSHPAIDEVFPPEALHAQLARADIVSVHLRATNETARLFDARAFAAMKRGATFVNTSRGAVVDESALVDALRGHRGCRVPRRLRTRAAPRREPALGDGRGAPHAALLGQRRRLAPALRGGLRRQHGPLARGRSPRERGRALSDAHVAQTR